MTVRYPLGHTRRRSFASLAGLPSVLDSGCIRRCCRNQALPGFIVFELSENTSHSYLI